MKTMTSLMNENDLPSRGWLPRLFGRGSQRDAKAAVDAIYAIVVAQARQPAFYARLGVPDSVEGRFDMILLHLCLALRRLRSSAGGERLGQLLFNRFCEDMDGNLREMGVGDLAVPKRMRKFGEAFYGRAAVYGAALDSAEPKTLTAAVARNIYGGHGDPDSHAALANYVAAAAQALAAAPDAAVLAGDVTFPQPSVVAGVHGGGQAGV